MVFRCTWMLLAASAAAALSGCGDDPGSRAISQAEPAATPTPSVSPTAAPTPTAQPTAAPSPAGDSEASEDARCRAEGLRGALEFGPGSGSAGASTGLLTLTNTSAEACTLAGYPGVSAVDDAGHQLGRAAARAPERYASVRLAPGAAARAPLRVADVSVFDASACRPAAAAGLRVYPPGSRSALFIRHALRACRGDQEVLDIRPFRRAAG